MTAGRKYRWTTAAILVSLIGGMGGARFAYAEGASRDLSGFSGPDTLFTVSIGIDAPNGTILVGLEEAPPSGWTVSNISDGGTWDTDEEEIKWGPFFDPSIPELVTYDVTPLGGAAGEHCFAGTVVLDTNSLPIEGEQCVAINVPALSTWGVVAMTLSLLVGGTIIFRGMSEHRVG